MWTMGGQCGVRGHSEVMQCMENEMSVWCQGSLKGHVVYGQLEVSVVIGVSKRSCSVWTSGG